MRWKGRRQSANVEDRRRMAPAGVGFGGGCLGLIILLIAIYLGADPQLLLNEMATGCFAVISGFVSNKTGETRLEICSAKVCCFSRVISFCRLCRGLIKIG